MNPPPVPPEDTHPSPPAAAAAPPPVPFGDSRPTSPLPPPPPPPVPVEPRNPVPALPPSWQPTGASLSVGDKPSAGLKSVWIGCAVLLLVAAIAIVVLVQRVYTAVKEQYSPEKIATGLVRTVLSQNPDIEFLDLDTAARTGRVKDRKSGEILTFRLEDVGSGKLTLTKSDGTTVEMSPNGIHMTDPAGKETTLGPGEVVPLPDWVPAYPGAAQVTTSSKSGDNGFRLLTTTEPLAEVRQNWERALADAGFNSVLATEAAAGGFQSVEIKASKPDGKIVEVVVSATAEKQTMMRLSYRPK